MYQKCQLSTKRANLTHADFEPTQKPHRPFPRLPKFISLKKQICIKPQSIIKMATIALIKEAILALKDRTGSSVPAITKWIETEKKVSNIGR